MATNCWSPTIFLRTCENAFYFKDGDMEIYEEDSFGMSVRHCKKFIRSKKDKFLLLNAEGQFEVQNLTIQQQYQADCRFDIQIYQEQSQGESVRRPVMLYANKDGKKMVACCNEKHEIYPEAMDLPHQIEETAHKALFFLKGLPKQTNKFMIESSLYPNEFLGFEPTEEDTYLDKLVLRRNGKDEVDEYCEVSLSL